MKTLIQLPADFYRHIFGQFKYNASRMHDPEYRHAFALELYSGYEVLKGTRTADLPIGVPGDCLIKISIAGNNIINYRVKNDRCRFMLTRNGWLHLQDQFHAAFMDPTTNPHGGEWDEFCQYVETRLVRFEKNLLKTLTKVTDDYAILQSVFPQLPEVDFRPLVQPYEPKVKRSTTKAK